jgi:hypothetical protein
MYLQVPDTASREVSDALEATRGKVAVSDGPILGARPANLALSSGHMSRHVLRSAAATAALIPFVIVLNTVGANGRQQIMPRALDAKDPVTYFISDGMGQSGYRPSDRELARWALEAWQRSAAKSLRLEAATESRAIVRLYWAEPRDGQYGEMRPLIVGGQRGAAVFIRPDVESLGPDLARRARGDMLLRDSIVYLTCLHEVGHALGLEHTRDFRDIMYYFGYGGDVVEYFSRYRVKLHSRNDIAVVSGLSDADVTHIKAIYSRE